VYDIQKGNTNDEIKFYMGYNEETGKGHEDSLELRILYFIWVLGAPYYQRGCIGWIGEVQIIKIYPQTKNPKKSRLIQVSDRIPESLSDMSAP
jgi:hypothetical protein